MPMAPDIAAISDNIAVDVEPIAVTGADKRLADSLAVLCKRVAAAAANLLAMAVGSDDVASPSPVA